VPGRYKRWRVPRKEKGVFFGGPLQFDAQLCAGHGQANFHHPTSGGTTSLTTVKILDGGRFSQLGSFHDCRFHAVMDPSQAISVDQSLNIAVDHRLRQCFMPLSKIEEKTPSSQIPLINLLGQSLLRGSHLVPKEEKFVTKNLAYPRSGGGIAAILFQPASSQQFHLGLDITIQDSPTLRVLNEEVSVPYMR
jgi:hypothetical protein